MLDIQLRIRLHDLIVDRCDPALEKEAKELFNSILKALEEASRPLEAKMNDTIKEIDKALPRSKGDQ